MQDSIDLADGQEGFRKREFKPIVDLNFGKSNDKDLQGPNNKDGAKKIIQLDNIEEEFE